jgi:hypothetical protein
LHNAPVEGDPAVHCGEKAKRAFAPYVGSLDRGAILQNGQQRKNRALRKIGVLEKATRVADNVAKLEPDRLKMGIYPLAAGRLQGAKQSVALQIIIGSCFGHFVCR